MLGWVVKRRAALIDKTFRQKEIMALFGEDFDLSFGDFNSSLLPPDAVFNFSMKEAYEILAKEVRVSSQTVLLFKQEKNKNSYSLLHVSPFLWSLDCVNFRANAPLS